MTAAVTFYTLTRVAQNQQIIVFSRRQLAVQGLGGEESREESREEIADV